ncbi:MAG: hypothetical protein F6K00_07605 [Leptolyngbya sp. SIOISBB]|nr:hypothetical protein [Leptolyngbya sp. SIOISBB]
MPSSYLTDLPDLAVIGLPLSVVVMMLLHCIIGLAAAQLAYRKGADLGFWLIWGMIGGTLSLVTALQLPTEHGD